MGKHNPKRKSDFPILQIHNTLPHFVGFFLHYFAIIWGTNSEFQKLTKDQDQTKKID